MQNIYRNSKLTLVWLGEPTASNEAALDLLTRCEISENDFNLTFAFNERSSGYTIKENIDSMFSYFTKPW